MSTTTFADYPDGELTGKVIASSYTVRREFKYGFAEPVYRRAMAVELQFLGVPVAQERPYELFHRGVSVGSYRADLVVGDRVIVEIKTGGTVEPTARAQLLNYLRVADLTVGLLIHFGPDDVAIKRLILSPEHRSGSK